MTPRTHLLARAVLRHGDHVLLARTRGHSFTFLPGGHVDPGEGVRACLARELLEETGLVVTIGVLLGVVEHVWTDDTGREHYELNHVFETTHPTLTHQDAVRSREPHLSFEWAHVEALDDSQLQPFPVRRLIEAGGRVSFASTLEAERTSSDV